MPHQQGIKLVAQNRKAFHDYFVEEKFECGIALFGTEVKSVRQGRVNLKESWAQVRKGEIWAEGLHISPYEQGNLFNQGSAQAEKAAASPEGDPQTGRACYASGLYAGSPVPVFPGRARET